MLTLFRALVALALVVLFSAPGSAGRLGPLSQRNISAHTIAGPQAEDSSTVVLLHFDGPSYADNNVGGGNHSWSPAGNATIDATQSRFGGSSLLLDGNGDYVTTPDTPDAAFGADEFTIDMWVRFNNLPTGDTSGNNWDVFMSQFSNTQRGWRFGVQQSGGNYQLVFLWNASSASGANTTTSNNVSISTGVWYHVAVVRDNSGTDTIRLFLDGVAVGTDSGAIDGLSINNAATSVRVGATADNLLYLDGWIDEVRVSSTARYREAFAPERRAYLSALP